MTVPAMNLPKSGTIRRKIPDDGYQVLKSQLDGGVGICIAKRESEA